MPYKRRSERMGRFASTSRAIQRNRHCLYPTTRFRDVTGHYVDYQGDRYFYLCGFFNSKNRFGGYRGWTAFMFAETFAPSHGAALSTADNLADNDLIIQMCDDGSEGFKLKDYSAKMPGVSVQASTQAPEQPKA